MITIKAVKAMLNPSTFSNVAALKRRNTLRKFLQIVFIQNNYFTLIDAYNLIKVT